MHKTTFKNTPLFIYNTYKINEKNDSTVNSLSEVNIKGDVNKHNIT